MLTIILVLGLHRYIAADGYNYYNQQQPYYQSAYPYNQQYYQPQAYQYNSNPTQYYGQYSQQYNSLPYDYRQNAYGYQSYPSYGTVINRQAPPYPSPGAQPISPPVPHPFYHTQGTYYPTVITEKPSGPKNST